MKYIKLTMFLSLIFLIGIVSSANEGSVCGYITDSNPPCDTGLVCIENTCVSTAGMDCYKDGYNFCSDDRYSHPDGEADARVEIYWRFVDGRGQVVRLSPPFFYNGPFSIGGLYLEIGGDADEYYLIENGNYEDDEDCNENGCNYRILKKGLNLLSDKEGVFTTCIYPFGWEYDRDSDGSWVWVTSGIGMFGNDNCFNINTFECTQDSDCESGVCVNPDLSHGTCEVYICDYYDERCFGQMLQRCTLYNEWEDKGIVLGKCGVECLNDQQCVPIDYNASIYNITYCSGKDILQEFETHECIYNKCSESSGSNITTSCDFRCEDVDGEGAMCIEKVCEFGEEMCSDKGNVLKCSGVENKWVVDEECSYGCKDEKCIPYYNTKQFYSIVGGSFFALTLLIIFLVKKVKKSK